MKPKMIIKMSVDLGMTVLMVFLMTYELIGQGTHEWLGVGMYVLFIVHHVLNRKWIQHVFKGHYTAVRTFQTVLVICVLLTMLGSMISGIILSQTVFSFLRIRGGSLLARSIHMVCAYGGYILMSMHFGIHWAMVMGTVKKHFNKQRKQFVWGFRLAALLFAGYGASAFVKRDIGDYMLLKQHFVFFDYTEPLIFFLLDYIAVMALFVFIGHYIAVFLKWYVVERKKRLGDFKRTKQR